MPLGPINKLPLGTLGFFGIKNLGRYPNAISDEIELNIECIDLYGANYGENRTDVENGVAATGFAEIHSVPADQVWYVQYATVRAVTGAGEAVVYSVGIQPTSTTLFHGLTGQSTVGASATSVVAVGRGFWAAQSDQIGVLVASFTGTIDFQMDLRILRWQI